MFFRKIFLSGLLLLLCAQAVPAKVSIYLCGDSTMQDWNEGYYPKRGIGQEFGRFWNADAVNVVNRGAGGTYAMGYYQKFWPDVLASLKAGDFVIIQFGINDRSYSNEADFVTATTAMANEALSKGAHPIIVNPVRRSDFRYSSAGLSLPDSIYESYHGYPVRAREIAASLRIPLIDMDTLSRNYLLSVGQFYALRFVNMQLEPAEYSTYANGNGDNLHLQQNGAEVFGRIMTEQMRVHSDSDVRKLAENLAPMYSLKVKVSPEGSDSATTVSTYYPAGMTVTLKTIPKKGKTFLGWFDGKGNRVGNSERAVSSEYICSFPMPGYSTQYTAVYGGGKAEIDTSNGEALSDFPKGTPRIIEGFTPTSGDSGSSNEKFDKSVSKWFDASSPDTFDVGWSESLHAGFIGDGYWNFDNAMNTFAAYRMIFPSAGYVTMGIVYANGGSSDRTLNVYLDHDYLVDFPPTGSWSSWDTAWVNVDLAKGEEVLKFISTTSDGGPNIDAFGFGIPGVYRKGETPDSADSTTAFRTVSKSGKSLSGKWLNLDASGKVKIRVFDMSGRSILYRETFAREGVSELPVERELAPGVYRISVDCGKEVLHSKLIVLR